MVLFAMLYGAVPFKATNMTDLYKQVLRCSPVYKDTVSSSGISLLKAILTRNPKERLTCDQILKHPWMTKEKDEKTQIFTVVEE